MKLWEILLLSFGIFAAVVLSVLGGAWLGGGFPQTLNDNMDCNVVIHEGELSYLNLGKNSVTFEDGASYLASSLWVVTDYSGKLHGSSIDVDYSIPYKLLRCSKNMDKLILIPSSLQQPQQYTPFNPKPLDK